MNMSELNISNARKSSIIQTHLDLGASLKIYFGWQMPSSYFEVGKEVWSVRNHLGLIDLSFLGVIKIGGKEGAQFLQGLVSNDVKILKNGQGHRAAFLTGHGKIKAFCVILSLGDEYLIINDPQTHDKIYNYIFPFSYAGDFQVEDVSQNYQALSLQGPDALMLLKECCFEPIPELPEYNWITTMIAGQEVIVMSKTHTGEIGFDLLIPEKSLKDVWDFLLLKGEFYSAIPVGLEALEVLRVEAGIPLYGVDVDESNMMLEAGLDDAVSYYKGGYTGQEAIAMGTYRGHVSKKLSGLIFDSDAEISQGDKIVKDGKNLGVISSTIKSETLKRKIALACIKYGFFTPGEKVEIITAIKLVKGEVVQLPFTGSLPV